MRAARSTPAGSWIAVDGGADEIHPFAPEG
jgi:hypothetical protein